MGRSKQTSRRKKRERVHTNGAAKRVKVGVDEEGNDQYVIEGVENPRQRQGWEEIVKENEAFTKYYKLQGIVPEGEWDDFIAAFQRILPTTFRLTGTKAQMKDLRASLEKNYFPDMENIVYEGKSIPKPSVIPWFPDGMGYHFEAPRIAIRKDANLKKFHGMLVAETEQGNICRQEAVSMIPPLFMDVKSHHRVLDMCAAPGSKTTQLMEMMHADVPEGELPTGVVVANDANNKRCYMLVHQTKRLQSPCLMVTNHDASCLPTVFKKSTSSSEKRIPILYDRILCDVPCTGDGTLRKNPNLWKQWNYNMGTTLFPLQERILQRGIQLLAVGGQLVYSTCSLNPIEDEAVLASVLSQHEGCLELVDMSNELKELKRMEGLWTWTFCGKDGTPYEKYEDVPADQLKGVHRNMFPLSLEKAKALHLERAMRVLPHSQDTGGFFIAVIRKTKAVGRTDAQEEVKIEDTSAKMNAEDPSKNTSLIGTYKEDPFVFLEEEEAGLSTYKEVEGFFEFNEKKFPQHLLLTRKEGGKKHNIYMVSEGVKQLISGDCNTLLKVINTGVKTIARTEASGSKCVWRICQEGVNCMLPFLKAGTSRMLNITLADTKAFLKKDSVSLLELQESTRSELYKREPGSIILCFDPKLEKDGESVLHSKMYFCAWKGTKSCRLYVIKKERDSILHLLEDKCYTELNNESK
eukprot:Nk52_evm23s2496 gene=Nk52_evmTU23s2496